MIVHNLQKKIAEAMKARDEVRLSTLRMLSSALNYEKIAKQHDLSEQEEIAVVRREAKKRLDAIESLRQARDKQLNVQTVSVEERLAREEKELEILKEYLPEELSAEELKEIVEKAILSTSAGSIADMGRVMSVVTEMVAGRAEGRTVAELVKSKLSQT